ncbi:adhesion G-protein coupled receptor G4-like [Patiria miniata]|uniref:Uncharacterized protein n=1 Tax=Patiria miniata TaxID=46514 RepID=A0A914ABK7_PATMI|nr:adhesion G-protein coupled receptor G4-like [Patiria miniata]
MQSLNDTAMKVDLQIVPPVALEIGVFNVILSVMSSQGVEDLLQGVLMTAELSVIQCEQGDDCEAFFKEWTGLETDFKELKCGNGLQQEYLSYQQCRESSAPGPGNFTELILTFKDNVLHSWPYTKAASDYFLTFFYCLSFLHFPHIIAPVVSSSARYLIEAPSDLPSDQPFPVECPIENAASYDWYRINADGQRDFVTNGYALIFPSFEELRDQGAYICVGRGRGSLIDVTAEYQAIIMKSGITTLMANVTLVNGTFTDDLLNTSSAAFKNLTDDIRSKMPLDMIYKAVVSYEVSRFYPGSVIVDFKVIVNSPSNESDADTVVSMQRALSEYASTNPGLGLDPYSVKVVSLSSCPREVLELQGKNVTFPQTRIGLGVEILEECVVGEKHGRVLISRDCSGDFTVGAQWLQPVLGNCSVDVNGQLDILKKITVTSENVVEVSESLESLTKDASSINGEAVALVADVLDNILTIRDPSPEITSSVVSVVNNLLQVNDEAFNNVPDGDSTSRIVQGLDSQISYVLEDGANFTAVTPSLAVEALNIPPSSLHEGVGFVVKVGESTDGVLKNDSVSVYYPISDFPAETVESSIHLPDEILLKHPTAASPVPISFTVYQTSKLFHSKRIAEAESTGSRLFVDSAIISATVVGVHVENLPDDNPVVVTFNQNPVIEGAVQCVFWDNELQDGVGDWSPEGCRLVTSISERTVCHCDHATSFAVLVDIHGQKYSSLALDIISKIGCAVSIASLVFTIIIYLSIKSLREKTPSCILICFSFSLLCLYLVFLVGIEQTSSRIGCIIVAVLMHYFTLSSMAWMGVEATNLYLKLVKVFNSNVEHFMVKASIAAWGLPMIVVGVILAVNYKEYENESSCFLKRGAAFYYGQLLIIGLVFLYNAVIFVLIAHSLTCKANYKVVQSSNTKGKRSQMVKRLQNMAAISVLLGLTWAFGLLSVIESSNFAFQVLFCVFNSLQGLFIFLLFVVRHDNVRGKVLGCLQKTLVPCGTLSSSASNLKLKSQSRLNDVGDGGNGMEGNVYGNYRALDQMKVGLSLGEEECVSDNQITDQSKKGENEEKEENVSENEAFDQLKMDEIKVKGENEDEHQAMTTGL